MIDDTARPQRAMERPLAILDQASQVIKRPGQRACYSYRFPAMSAIDLHQSLHQIHNPIRVAPLVVIPGDDFDQGSFDDGCAQGVDD